MTLNSDKPWPSLEEAKSRVLHFQQKLHRWSQKDPEKRFSDLFNWVHEEATLVVAWHHVKSNRGSKTAGRHRASCVMAPGPAGASTVSVGPRERS